MSIIDELTAILPVRWEPMPTCFLVGRWAWTFSGIRLTVHAFSDATYSVCLSLHSTDVVPHFERLESSGEHGTLRNALNALLSAYPWIRELAMRDRILGVVRGARVEACVAGPFIDAAWMDGRISWRLKRSLQHDTQPFYEPWKAQAGSIEYWESDTRFSERYYLNREGPHSDAGTLTEEVWI